MTSPLKRSPEDSGPRNGNNNGSHETLPNGHVTVKGVSDCPQRGSQSVHKGGVRLSSDPITPNSVTPNPIKDRGLLYKKSSFCSLINRATEVTGNRSNRGRRYLARVLADWEATFGQERATEMFADIIATVEDRKARGKIRGNVAGYLASALRTKRLCEEEGYDNKLHRDFHEEGGYDAIF
jgi:hypothetical protein